MGWIVTCSVFRYRFRHSFLWFSPRFFCERISTSLADLLLEHSGPNLSQRMLSRNTFWSSNLPFVLQLLVENALQCNFCADSSYVQFVLSREFCCQFPTCFVEVRLGLRRHFALKALAVLSRKSAKPSMPVVVGTDVHAEYLIGLIAKGDIQHISGYIPDDEGQSIPAVFTDLSSKNGVKSHGINLNASIIVPNGTVPKKFEDGNIMLHLCMKEGCKSGTKHAWHLGEWAYLAEGENGEGGPLLACLAAARLSASATGPPPGLAVPQKFSIHTPAKDPQPRVAAAGGLSAWLEKHQVPETLDLLVANGFREVRELGMLDRADVDAMFTESGLMMGTKSRFLLAIRTIQQDPLPEALPPSAAGMVGSGAAGAPIPSSSGFGSAGPLQELTAGCRQLLSQVGGSKAIDANLAAEIEQSVQPREASPLTRAVGGQAPTFRQVATESIPRTAGGRLLSGTGTRAPATSVALSVPSWQAAAIEEEWTDDGRMSFMTAVRTAKWKKTENQEVARSYARQLDVAKASGQVLAEEASAEVTCRDLAALWFADQHPKDHETADFLRESSTARWGVPAEMWKEAREFRKLSQGIKSD